MALTERYTIDQKLGEGGFGAVFRGTHRQMSTPVAIKVLHAQHASSSETVARFEQEARRSAALKHPNTIRVFDFGRDDDGSLFLVMELLDGAPLSHHIKQGRLASDRVVHIIAQALSALDEAHQQGLVHRDLKPDNIFLTRLGKDPDFVKVLDFGIAKALDANAKLTASGVVIGTPTYMSPEQCRGAALDPRSDLYSLACIAYEMLAGRPPFLSDTIVGYIFAHVQQAPDLTKLAPNVPEHLVAWVGRCLEKDPAARYSSADEARDALLATPPHSSSSSPGAHRPPTSPALANHPTHTPVALDTARSNAPPRRHGRWLAIGGGVIAVGLLGWGIVEITSATSYVDNLPEPVSIATHVEPAPVSSEPTDHGSAIHRAEVDATALGSAIHRAEVEPADTLSPAGPDVTPDTTPPEPEVSAPVTHRVALSTVPTGATVKRDGQVLGQTPLELTWLVGETTPFKVELKNHDTVTLRPTALTGKTVHEVRLTRSTSKDVVAKDVEAVDRVAVAGAETDRVERLIERVEPEPVRTGPSKANVKMVSQRVIGQCAQLAAGASEPIKLTVRFAIRANGSVMNVDLAGIGGASAELQTCLKRGFGAARFETFTGDPITVSYPVVLR